MTDDLVFYTNPMSRGRIVRWMLEEVGALYRTEVLDYATTIKGDAYHAINPMLKVPAIVQHGIAVTETAAICTYLANAFPAAGLAPAPADRGAYYRWLFFAAGCVETAITNKSLGFEPPPEKHAMVGYGSLGEVTDALEAAVTARAFIAGNGFSAADVYVGAQIGCGMAFGSIERRPAFEACSASLFARPAAAQARAIDDALLPEEMRGKM